VSSAIEGHRPLVRSYARFHGLLREGDGPEIAYSEPVLGPLTQEESMATVAQGTVLSCGHEGCGCRVVIQEECHCTPDGTAYICICGSPLEPVES
jgi:hypothetical protein